MTEDDAQTWVSSHYPDQYPSIATFLAMVREENGRQNLISASTVDHLWARHAVDSLQLMPFGHAAGKWVDIGSGAGFPGLMIAIVRPAPMVLIEPRQKRAIFLRNAIKKLKLDHVEVEQSTAERVDISADIISARAVGSLDYLINLGTPWGSIKTRWILPRGGLTDTDMAILSDRFPDAFHVEQSVTSPTSNIVIAMGRPSR